MSLVDFFREDNYGEPSCSLGNVFISGIDDFGANETFINMVKDVLKEKKPVLIMDVGITDRDWLTIKNTARTLGYSVKRLGVNSVEADSFNLLSIINRAGDIDAYAEECANFILMLVKHQDDSSDLLTAMKRYIKNAVKADYLMNSSVRLNRVLDYRVEEVADVVGDDFGFLLDSGTYAIWGKINDRSSAYRTSGLLNVLSGDKVFDTAFGNEKTLLAICPSLDEDITMIMGLLRTVVLSALVYCNYMNRLNKPYHVFLSGLNFLDRNIYEYILQCMRNCMDKNMAFCVYERYVGELINSYGNNCLAMFNYVAVFKSYEGDIWEQFFTSRRLPERALNYSRGLNIFNRFPGGITSGVDFVNRGTLGRQNGATVHMVDRPLYPARVFSDLRDNEAVTFNAKKNRRQKKKVII